MVGINSKLSIICGLTVEEIDLSVTDARLTFGNGINLAIYNNFTVIGIVPSDAKKLIGKAVMNVDEKESTVTITFEDGMHIQIDLKNEAYNGPEAMQLRVPGMPIVIWN